MIGSALLVVLLLGSDSSPPLLRGGHLRHSNVHYQVRHAVSVVSAEAMKAFATKPYSASSTWARVHTKEEQHVQNARLFRAVEANLTRVSTVEITTIRQLVRKAVKRLEAKVSRCSATIEPDLDNY
jgi:hypothetical protein